MLNNKLLYRSLTLAVMTAGIFGLTSCSEDDPEIPQGTYTEIKADTSRKLSGVFYLINEGNMGANKCTIDFVDLKDMRYYANIYAENNPGQVMELGDTGNDAAIYDGDLYIVVNGSHKVEVLDADDCEREGQIDINSPRYIAFKDRYAYVSSYVGGTPGPNGDNGTVVKVDTETLRTVATVSVGGCPEEIAIVGDRAYVVNSGIYPNFENTLSVIDLKEFKVIGQITVAPNMHHVKADANGNLWVNSRGDYNTVPSRLYRVEPAADITSSRVTEIPVNCANFVITKDMLYYYSSEYSYATQSTTIAYGAVRTTDGSNVEDALTEALNKQTDIISPYCIAYDRRDNIMLVTDARNYVSSGWVYGYAMDGTRLFGHSTGDIPGHIAFVN